MSKSILKHNYKGTCYLCKRVTHTENHHIFGGSNRKKADKDGLTVYLCHWCHNEPPKGVHHNREYDLYLKRIGQAMWMKHYGKDIEDFIKAYGRKYL